MIHPRIDELMNKVDSRYALVIVAAKVEGAADPKAITLFVARLNEVEDGTAPPAESVRDMLTLEPTTGLPNIAVTAAVVEMPVAPAAGVDEVTVGLATCYDLRFSKLFVRSVRRPGRKRGLRSGQRMQPRECGRFQP